MQQIYFVYLLIHGQSSIEYETKIFSFFAQSVVVCLGHLFSAQNIIVLIPAGEYLITCWTHLTIIIIRSRYVMYGGPHLLYYSTTAWLSAGVLIAVINMHRTNPTPMWKYIIKCGHIYNCPTVHREGHP